MDEGCHGHKAAEDLFLNSQYHGDATIAVPPGRLKTSSTPAQD